MRKILLYNWVQFDDEDGVGGGVTVYLKNLIERLINEKYEIYFLSSGNEYNIFKREVYINKTKNIFGEKVKTFKIVNSPVIAPARWGVKNVENIISNDKLKIILKNFILKYGPFDVIHFHNLEGLSLNCLDLKKDFVSTKFIFTFHNYVPVCPTVSYFREDIHKVCEKNNGDICIKCIKNLTKNKDYINEPVKRGLGYKNGWKIYKYVNKYKIFEKYKKIWLKEINLDNQIIYESSYRKYKERFKKKINENIDVILCVSRCTKRIVLENGFNDKKIKVSYIGTKVAENIKYKSPNNDQKLNIAYLGYANEQKGYYFFIDALSKLPIEYRKRLNVLIAAKDSKCDFIQNQLKNYNKIEIYNGYTHDNLEKILENIELGIVPVLWEDNLPQIAIEFIAKGVPILCSDYCGFYDLFNYKFFVFNGSDTNDLLNKLIYIINNKIELKKFWNYTYKLVTMDEHIKELKEFYE